jgi:hypothetical protein
MTTGKCCCVQLLCTVHWWPQYNACQYRLVRCLKCGVISRQLCDNYRSGIEHVQTNFPVRISCPSGSSVWLPHLFGRLACMAESSAWQSHLLDWLSCLTDSVVWLTQLLELLTCLSDFPAWLTLLLDCLTCLTGSAVRLAPLLFMTDERDVRGHLTREPGDPLASQF